MSSKKRGQVSMEYLIIVGFVIIMLIPATYIYLRYSGSSSDTLSSAKATQIAGEIAKAADEVYYLGADNQKNIEVSFPANIEVIEFDNKEIVFKVRDSKGNLNEIVEVASVPLSGALPNIQGNKVIIVKSLGSRVSVNVVCNSGETLDSSASTCSAFGCRSPCGLVCQNKVWGCSACSDSSDNDGDTKIDFDGLGGALPDAQCSSRADNDENV